MDLGHRMLDKALAERGTTLEQFDDAQIQRVLREYAHKRLEELLAEIALGSRVPSLVARQFLAGRQGDENTGISTEQALQISGQDSQVVTFPHCCHPIPGDAILGYLSAGKGLVLHRRNCHNVPGLKKNPDRLVEVEWAPNCKGEFTVTLRVETRNRRGVLAAISAAISASGSNIEHIEYAQRDGEVATLMFMITVSDRNHLARVMRRVRLENDVTRVDRATL